MGRYRRRLRKQNKAHKGPSFRADLHMHTLRSDGRKSSAQVLSECARGGLQVIAITDHDIAPIVQHGVQCIEGKIVHVIHGVELSGTHEDKEYHLLAYFPEEMPEEFRLFCRDLCRSRSVRYDKSIDNLGMNLPKSSVQAQRGEMALTRTHLAQEMVRAGYVDSYRQAFQIHLNRPDVVPRIELSFIDAIKEAKRHGAFLSWAHPSLEVVKRYGKKFSEEGLDALEVIRPRQGKRQRKDLRKMAEHLGLFISGGSDSHGSGPALGTFAFSSRDMLWSERVGINPSNFNSDN